MAKLFILYSRCRSYTMSREEYPYIAATQDRKISMPPTAPPTMNFKSNLARESQQEFKAKRYRGQIC